MNKKKIALIVDVANWAFDIEAKILKNALAPYYDIDIFIANAPRYNNDLYLILEDTFNYDIIHVFFRKLLLQFDSDAFKKHFQNQDEYELYIKTIRTKISTGIYDHLFLDEENIKLYHNVFTNYIKMYYTCSKRLEKIYNALHTNYKYPKPYGTIYDVYDGKRFKNNRNRTFHKALVIGWVGNSQWNIKYHDYKGFNTILVPIVEELIKEGYDIKKNFADKNIKFLTKDEMLKYYQDIDICVISSSQEGTPRPLFEAMASGVVVVATDVGIVNEIFGPLAKSCIIGDRNLLGDEQIKYNLKKKIIELYNNREKLKEISLENIQFSKKCDINYTFLQYKEYFDIFLSR